MSIPNNGLGGPDEGNGAGTDPLTGIEGVAKPGRVGDTYLAEQVSPAARMELERQLRSLGEALNQRTAEVVRGIQRRNQESGVVLEAIVEESFVKVGTVSTEAVARWMAGEGAEVAREVG